METLVSSLDQAKAYRNNLAKKINQQRLLTTNRLAKLFVKKSPEDVLNQVKNEPNYTEAEKIVREQHKQVLVEIEREKRIQEAKRWLPERVMYYSQDGKIPMEEIKKDFYGKFIKWDKGFQVSTYINNENFLKHSNEFSQEEKDLLIEIAWTCWIKWLKILSIYTKQWNILAENHIQKILSGVMSEIRKLGPAKIEKTQSWAMCYYPISEIKGKIDEVIAEWCGEYMENIIKNEEDTWFITLSLADGWIPPTEEQIQKIETYKNYSNSIVETLVKNGKFREAFLLNRKNRENRWNFDRIKWTYKRNNNKELTDHDFIKIIVENKCGWIILSDYIKLELTRDQEKNIIKEMITQWSTELSGETLERVSLMHPGIFGAHTNNINLLDEDKKLLSRDDLWQIYDKNENDKELQNYLRDYGDNDNNIRYLLENGYLSAAIDLFLKTSKIEKFSPEIINTLLNKIINWKANPFTINPYYMGRSWLESEISVYHSFFFGSLPYNIGIFLKCIDKLTNEQLTKIEPLLNKVIMENNFRGTFAVDIGWYSYNIIKSRFLNNNLYRLIRWRFISEESLEKLRKDSHSWTNAINHRLRESILFEEWNPVANPYPENSAWKKLWNRLPNNSIYNKNKQAVVDNIEITNTTNYYWEIIPALRIFWKKISFLTYHTNNDSICYEKDWRLYINKNHAEEIAKAQGKKILDNIEIPAEYWYEYTIMVKWTHYLRHEDIVNLLDEYAPYCKINYRIEEKKITLQDGFDGKWEQFFPVVVCE